MTPYELNGIDNYRLRERDAEIEYQQRLRDIQQYQQQEIIEQLERANDLQEKEYNFWERR
jgi:hypothetical protein